MSHDPDLWQELSEIAASVRALAEWHASTGASGLLTDASPSDALASLAAPAAAASGRSGARPGGAPMHAPPMHAPSMHAPSMHAPVTPPAPRAPMTPYTPATPPGATSHGVAPPPISTTRIIPPTVQAVPPARVAQPSAPGPLTMAASPAADMGGLASRPRPEPVARPLLAVDGPPPAILTSVTGSESDDERRVKLAMIAEEVRGCTRCGLHAQRKQTVFARGNPFAEVCFIGEGPGADEDAQGLPFVGKAGQLLDRMIMAMGYGRDDVYVCNIVKCRPPENRKPEPNEMASCTPYLTGQLALTKPRVIVALGATAVQGLTGISEGITRMRGKWKLYKGKTPLMPTFHPAYLLRQPNAKREVWDDLKEVLRHLGKSPPEKR